MMLFIQLAVVLLFIFLGARKGGLGIAYAGVPASSSWDYSAARSTQVLVFRGTSLGSSSQ